MKIPPTPKDAQVKMKNPEYKIIIETLQTKKNIFQKISNSEMIIFYLTLSGYENFNETFLIFFRENS